MRASLAFRCAHCAPERVLLSTSDGRRRDELRPAAEALASDDARDHQARYGHQLELIEVFGA